MTDEDNMMNNQCASEISPPISPPLLRRSYSTDSESDILYRHQPKCDVNLIQQLLQSSPQLQRDLVLFYEQQQQQQQSLRNGSGGGGGPGLIDPSGNYIDPLQIINSNGVDSFERELSNRLRLRRNLNDSMGSLTDSDFYNSDVEQRQNKFKGFRGTYENDGNGNNVKEDVAISLSRVGRLLDMLSNLPWPRMSSTAMGICFLIATFISPKACVQNILFPAFRLVFGTLYPAYASYKAVRTKNVKEYVKWMMYWIVFAFFTCIETFTDIFLSWLPLYYEVKVIVVLWLLNPATKGSSVLYRKFVHPMLTRREQEIDEYLNQAKERGYTAVIQLGSKGVNYATNVIMQTALKGGGNLVQTIRRSYSLSDLSEPDVHRTQDEVDELTRPQHRGLRPRTQVGRSSSSGARHSTGMYFSEIDVGAKGPVDSLHYNIKSSEDISSGYSSAEPISGGLSRTSSMTSSKGLRFKAKKPEDENFSEYDENEYLMRENFVPNLNFTRSQSLIESGQTMPVFPDISQQNRLKQNSHGVETNLELSLQKTLLDDIKEQAFLDSEKLSVNLKQNMNEIKSGEENIITIPPQINPEMQSKFEMFCEWLEKGESESVHLKNDAKVDIQRQTSDDEFKDTISVGSNEDNSLEKFDDAFSEEVKKNDNLLTENQTGSDFQISEEIKDNLKDQNLLKLNNESTEDNQKIIEGTLKSQLSINKEDSDHEKCDKTVEEVAKSTLKENISIAVDSVTKLKDHILKLSDERSKVEFKKLDITSKLPLSCIKSDTENIEEARSNSEIKGDSLLALNFSETKKSLHHGKGKAPEPPLITSTTSNLTSSNLFKPVSPYETSKPYVTPRPPSPTTTQSSASNNNQNSVELTTNSTPSTPLSSSPSSPTISSSELSSQIQPSFSSKISSNSRSPSPKPVPKPRRNIFRSYLPSIFRSESPKPKAEEEYPGKETQI